MNVSWSSISPDNKGKSVDESRIGAGVVFEFPARAGVEEAAVAVPVVNFVRATEISTIIVAAVTVPPYLTYWEMAVSLRRVIDVAVSFPRIALMSALSSKARSLT